MDMVLHAANLQGGELMRPANAAQVAPHLLHLRREPPLPVFCGEDDVNMQGGEGIGQGMRRAGIPVSRTRHPFERRTGYRGLKPAATVHCR